MKKRILAMLLTVCMVLSMLPMSALAARVDDEPIAVVPVGEETHDHDHAHEAAKPADATDAAEPAAEADETVYTPAMAEAAGLVVHYFGVTDGAVSNDGTPRTVKLCTTNNVAVSEPAAGTNYLLVSGTKLFSAIYSVNSVVTAITQDYNATGTYSSNGNHFKLVAVPGEYANSYRIQSVNNTSNYFTHTIQTVNNEQRYVLNGNGEPFYLTPAGTEGEYYIWWATYSPVEGAHYLSKATKGWTISDTATALTVVSATDNSGSYNIKSGTYACGPFVPSGDANTGTVITGDFSQNYNDWTHDLVERDDGTYYIKNHTKVMSSTDRRGLYLTNTYGAYANGWSGVEYSENESDAQAWHITPAAMPNSNNTYYIYYKDPELLEVSQLIKSGDMDGAVNRDSNGVTENQLYEGTEDAFINFGPATGWGNTVASDAALTLDFGQIKKVDRIRIVVGKNDQNKWCSYRLECSQDNTNWATVQTFDGKDSGQDVWELTFEEPIYTRYLRLYNLGRHSTDVNKWSWFGRFAAWGENEPANVPTCTVTFEDTTTVTLTPGECVGEAFPQQPAPRDNETFLGWYTENDELFERDTAVMKDTVVYARWRRTKLYEANENGTWDIPYSTYGVIYANEERSGDDQKSIEGVTVNGARASLAIDGIEASFYHSNYNNSDGQSLKGVNPASRWIGIDLGAEKQVSGFRYLPRQSSGGNGYVKEYAIEVSNSLEGPWKRVAHGVWDDILTNKDWHTANFPAVNVRYVRLRGVAVDGEAGNNHMTAAEIRAIGPDTPVLDVKTEGFTQSEGWGVWSGAKENLYHEGADGTVHFSVRQHGTPVNTTVPGDFICMEFDGVKEVQQVRIVMGDGSADKWDKYALEYSLDGENWTQINEYTGETSGKEVWNERLDTEPVYARYLRLVNTAENNKPNWVKLGKFIAFGDNDPTLDTYTVTFNADGGEVTPATAQVVLGNTVGELPTPTKTGYTFLGWFNGETAFTADTVVTGDLTVTAKWAVDETTAVAMIGEDYYPTLQAAIDAAMDGQTVEVIKDAVGAALTESKSVTVNVHEGVTVSAAEGKAYALAVDGEGAVLTVTGSGAIQGTTYGVVAQKKGALNVSENFTGTISGETGLRCATEAVANVHSGTITSTKANGMVVSTGRSDNRGTIHVYGGTFANVDGTAYDMHSRPNVTVHYTYFYQNETGKVIELTEENSEAKLGDVLYHTLLEAVLKAPANTPATITLLNHVDLRDHMEPADDQMVPMPYVEIYDDINITLDLNGKTLRAPLINHGILTITGNGTVDASDTNDNRGYLYPAVQNYKAADAETDLMPHTIIENGTFVSGKGEVCCVYDQAGTIEIKGGSFTATNNQPAVRKIGNDTNVEISGGTFSSDVTAFCAENKKATTEDNTVWTIVDKSYVAAIGEKKYETLTEALVAATAGQTVTLLKGDAQTIDLANYADGLTDVTLTAAQDVTCAGITVTGTGSMTGFTFQGIDFNSTGHCVSFSTNAAVEGITFDGCSFTCNGKNESSNLAIHMWRNTGMYTDVTVIDCTFNTCGQGVYVPAVDGLTVAGCTFTDIGEYGTNGPAIHPGDVAANGTITITGNTFIDCINSPLVMFQLGEDATVQVNNNTFTHIGGRYMLMTKAGEEEKVTFSGNTWDGLALTAGENFNPVPNGSGGVRFGVTPVVEVYRGDVVNDAYLAYILASADSAVYFANKEDLKTLYFVAEGKYDIGGLTVGDVNITAADNLKITENDDGTVTVSAKTYVAAIGEEKYETLAEALAAATAGQTVTLLADVTEDATLDSGVSVTLNTGDYTVKATVFVENSSTLTFNGNSDTTERGHEGTADNNFIVKSGANLIVTDGEIKSGCTAVYVENGTATIQDGTFSVDGPWDTKYLLNLWDKATTASITVEGGTFHGYDPANSASENPKMDFLAESKATETTDGVVTVIDAAAQVTGLTSGKTKGYATVEAAIEAADLGDTVTLLQRPEAGKIVIPDEKAVQLRFNPDTNVEVDCQAHATTGGGSYVLYGGLEQVIQTTPAVHAANNVHSQNVYFYLFEDVTLTDDITLPSYNATTTGIYARANVAIDLNGHNITQQPSNAGQDGTAAVLAYTGDLVIKGQGTITGGAIGATVYPNQTLTLEEATITTKGSRYNDWCGAAVWMYGGEFIMEGGKLAAPTAGNSNGAFWMNGNTKNATITIKGGEIENVSAEQILAQDTSDGFTNVTATNDAVITYAITGGTFDMDLTGEADAAGNEYLDNTTYWSVKDADAGTWTVKEKTVAKIGDATYHSLQAAIDAATDGDTVTLLKDVTESVTVTGDKEITLNIPEGMTLTNEAGKHTITVAEEALLIITGAGTVDNVSHKCAALVNYGGVELGISGQEKITLTRSKENGQDADNNGGNSYYTIDNHGDMYIHSATVKNEGKFSSLIRNIGEESDPENDYKGSLTINEGAVLCGGINNVKNDDWGYLGIFGGTFEDASQYAVMNWSKADIYGGTFDQTVWNGVYTKDDKTPGVGTLNISSANGIMFNGETSLKIKDGDVSISGGTFAGAVEVVDAEKTTLEISGGTFTTANVNDYCVAGKCQNPDVNGGKVDAHALGELIPEVPAQIGVEGKKAYYECSVCGQLFDEEQNEVTAEELVITALEGAGKITAFGDGETDGVKTVTFGEGAVINFTADGNDAGRAPNHWWAGFRMEAPEGVTADATYTVKLPWAEESKAKLWSENEDGEFWVPVDQLYIDTYGGAEKTLTFTYKFDWTGESDLAKIQTVTMTVTNGIVHNMDGVVATTGGLYYGTLTEAVAAAANGGTVTLLKDASGAGVIVNKSITIDFVGHTYTVDQTPLAGSGEKYATQAFQLLAGANKANPNSVTMKNGTIVLPDTVANLKMGIQNYTNLTLENMNLDASQNSNITYVLSNNNGNTTITGNTTIKAAEGKVAFDVYDYSSNGYPSVKVVVDDADVTVEGKIEVSDSEKAALEISAGTFTANVNDYCVDGLCQDPAKRGGAVGEHVEVIDKGVEATYLQPGKTEGSHCEICGEVFVAQETIPMLKLASVTAYGKGKVVNNRTPYVTVIFDNTSDELVFAADGNDYGRTPNKWWAGIHVAGADGVNNAAYRKVSEWWNDETNVAEAWPEIDWSEWTGSNAAQEDGQYWAMATPAYMNDLKGGDNQLTYRYAFDWNGDGDFDQFVAIVVKDTVKFSDAGKIAEVNGIAYPTLAEAIAAAKSEDDTVTLLKSTTESVEISAEKEITLSIPAGVTLTNEAGQHTITVAEGGSLIITGAGTVDNVSDKKAALLNYGDVTLGLYNETQEDGCITITRSKETGVDANTSGGNSYYTIDNHGYMMIDAATISQTGAYSSLIRNVGVESDDPFEMRGTLNINKEVRLIGGLNNIKNDDWGALWIGGGTFEKAAQYSVMNWSAAEIDSNDATFDKPVWNGVYTEGGKTPGVGELNISGGNFNGDPAVKVKDGNVSITGGTFATDVNDWCLNNGEQGGYCWHTEDHTVSTHTVEESWTNTDATNHWHECSRCGHHFDEVEHTWVKDRVIDAPSCTEKGTQHFTCSVCGAEKTEDIPALGHNLTYHEEVPATCTTDGTAEYWSCKRCEKLFSDADGKNEITEVETIPAKGHTEEIIPGEAATCTETGLTEGKKCSVCGEIITAQEIIPANGHTEVIDTAVDATCTETGLTEGKHCSVCGEVLVAQETVDALGHDMKEVEGTAKAPTCTEDGKEADKKCSRCEHAETGAVIKATGHKWDAGMVTTQPTCEVPGVKTYTCSECGATKTEVIDALGHGTLTATEAVEATCTKAGNIAYWTCGRCGQKFSDEEGTVKVTDVTVPAKGHTVEIDAAVAPTCTNTGLTEGTHCSECGEVLVAQEIVAATGHTWGEWTTVTAATCTAQGSEKRTCSVCGAEETRDTAIDPNNHVGETEIRGAEDATCTTAGYTGDTYCLGCNTKIADGETIAALGHSFTNYVSDGNATCTKDGTKTATCDHEGCDVTNTVADLGSALGHAFSENWTHDSMYHWHVCTRDDCDATSGRAEHVWTVTEDPATCTTDGVRTFTCDCGETKTEVIPATGHSFTNYVSDGNATCTKDGTKTATCDHEGCDVTDTIVDVDSATGHVWDEGVVTVAATCEAPGMRLHTCSVCNVTKVEKIDALGHDFSETWAHDGTNHWHACSRCDVKDSEAAHEWSDWTEVTAATCTEKGSEKRTCSVCEAEETREIPATGHDMTKHEAVAATCTEEGNVEYWSCANCDKNFADEAGTVELETVVTEALGHDFTKFAFDENGHWHVCAHEGCEERMPDEEPAAHTWDAGVVSGNIRTFTCECGATRTQTISTGGGGGRPTTPTPPEEDLNEPDVPLAKPFLFTDVTENDWFYEAVKDVFEKDLMQGINAEGTLFAPFQITTRGAVATLIHRMENTPAAEKPSNFGDVEDAMWYTEAIHWTDESGVMIGYDDGNFYPNQVVTREQLALVLYRYAKFRGDDVSAKGDLSIFTDAEDVSSWAMDGMTWAVGNGLIKGRSGANLAPQGTTTRGELATILQRFVALTADTQGE